MPDGVKLFGRPWIDFDMIRWQFSFLTSSSLIISKYKIIINPLVENKI